MEAALERFAWRRRHDEEPSADGGPSRRGRGHGKGHHGQFRGGRGKDRRGSSGSAGRTFDGRDGPSRGRGGHHSRGGRGWRGRDDGSRRGIDRGGGRGSSRRGSHGRRGGEEGRHDSGSHEWRHGHGHGSSRGRGRGRGRGHGHGNESRGKGWRQYHDSVKQEPTAFQRHYTRHGPRKHDGVPLRLMSWNLLADYLVDQKYVTIQKSALDWRTRWRLTFADVDHYNPDIICFQEVEDYPQWFEPEFEKRGYDSWYLCRGGDKQDGCVIAWRRSILTLRRKVPINYFRIGDPLLDRHNVGQLALLELRQHTKHPGQVLQTAAQLAILNTHILFNIKRGDTKLAQLWRLLATVHYHIRLAESPAIATIATDKNSKLSDDGAAKEGGKTGRRKRPMDFAESKIEQDGSRLRVVPMDQMTMEEGTGYLQGPYEGEHGYVQAIDDSSAALGWRPGKTSVFLCGDFNSTPDSAIYEFLRTGRLCPLGLDRRNLSGQYFMSNACHRGRWPSYDYMYNKKRAAWLGQHLPSEKASRVICQTPTEEDSMEEGSSEEDSEAEQESSAGSSISEVSESEVRAILQEMEEEDHGIVDDSDEEVSDSEEEGAGSVGSFGISSRDGERKEVEPYEEIPNAADAGGPRQRELRGIQCRAVHTSSSSFLQPEDLWRSIPRRLKDATRLPYTLSSRTVLFSDLGPLRSAYGSHFSSAYYIERTEEEEAFVSVQDAEVEMARTDTRANKTRTGEPAFTMYHPSTRGTVDYVFFSGSEIQLRGTVEPPRPLFLHKVRNLPTQGWPSDHISLVVDFGVRLS